MRTSETTCFAVSAMLGSAAAWTDETLATSLTTLAGVMSGGGFRILLFRRGLAIQTARGKASELLRLTPFLRQFTTGTTESE